MTRLNPGKLSWGDETLLNKRKNDLSIYTVIFDMLMGGGKQKLSLVTFPADAWAFETSLSEMLAGYGTALSFQGVEFNRGVWARSIARASELKNRFPDFSYDCINTSFLHYMENQDPSYKADVIYLDWMGCWDQSSVNDLKMIFEKKALEDDSILIFTTMLNHRGRYIETPDIFRLAGSDKLNIPVGRIHSNYIRLLENPRRRVRENITNNFRRVINGIPNHVNEMAIAAGYGIDSCSINIYPGRPGKEINKAGRGTRVHQYEVSFIFHLLRSEE